jgi:ankyrin repeat protein
VATLSRYLTAVRIPPLGHRDYPPNDPFFTAAEYGSTNALRLLLEHWEAADPSIYSRSLAPDERDFRLLHTACGVAAIDTVRFLLSEPWQAKHGNIHAKDHEVFTPILSAAKALESAQYRIRLNKIHDSIESFLAKAEEVIHLLLDRGASVHNVHICTIYSFDKDIPTEHNVVNDTVLSLVTSQASPTLIKRLFNKGADIYAKIAHKLLDDDKEGFGEDIITGATAFHFGSIHSNVEGIRVLLDHARDLGDFEIAVCTDRFGRLPLHWAAWRPRYHKYALEPEQIDLCITATIELLLAVKPSTINAKDKVGDTALHYVVLKYGYNNDKHFVILQTLCKHGADSSICGRQGKTPLHSLASCVHGRNIISISLIDLLLEHGASVYDIDDDGNTPLHLVATDILYSKSAQQLISKGADVSATNNHGNTSLHHAAKGIFSL